MAKLSLTANPTFKAKVGIPVPGGAPVDVEMEFKHRPRPEFAEWLKALEGKNRVTAVMECVKSWELDDPFNEESVTKLNDNYMGAANAIVDKYLKEISGARQGN